jgi:hypothetical protein
MIPDDEVTPAPGVTPDGRKDGYLISLPVKLPGFVHPRVKINGQFIAAAVRAYHSEGSEDAAIYEDEITRPFDHRIGLVPMRNGTAIADPRRLAHDDFPLFF